MIQKFGRLLYLTRSTMTVTLGSNDLPIDLVREAVKDDCGFLWNYENCYSMFSTDTLANLILCHENQEQRKAKFPLVQPIEALQLFWADGAPVSKEQAAEILAMEKSNG